MAARVSQRNGCVTHAESLGPSHCTTVKTERRPATFGANDFDVTPADAILNPGAERLGRSLLGGEPGGEAFGSVAFPAAIGNLPRQEDALAETISIADKNRFNARYFDHVQAAADDHVLDGTIMRATIVYPRLAMANLGHPILEIEASSFQPASTSP